MTYKTLNTNSYDDHMHWCGMTATLSAGSLGDWCRLTYWVVFGVFDVFDGALDYLLYWLPYYELLKLIFLVWCFLPGTKVSHRALCCVSSSGGAAGLRGDLQAPGAPRAATQRGRPGRRH